VIEKIEPVRDESGRIVSYRAWGHPQSKP